MKAKIIPPAAYNLRPTSQTSQVRSSTGLSKKIAIAQKAVGIEGSKRLHGEKS